MSTQRHETRYTHIPITFRDEYNDKTYGTIVLDGAMSDTERDELDNYLVRGNEYRPAILELVGLEMNRLDDEWFEMNLSEMTIVTTARLSWDGELDEHPRASIEDFIAAFKAAAERQWRLHGTLHVEIDAASERGWQGTTSALESVIGRVEEQLRRGDLRDLPFTAVTNEDGHVVGRVWVTD
ncbi:hypothetical protein [Mycobacterium avium]|uniref:Uncharacterized protein n=1 Tax=Mycobacterium avium subsp. hominissuis TaxID=439334 RepID=A0AAI8ST13_MYCAV|nr:hypothetical protein [Mycobacterium avium]PBA08558.1 hypothetical protein CKJ70_25700 [Mycobacterium avium]BBN50758.1 hypothetical protein JPH1_52330 [Mycobacterium avium subsp. hominissuis]